MDRGSSETLNTRAVFATWWPLAASWLLMGVEMPLVSAFVARMPEAKLQLAAYGVAFAISLVIEGPIIMLLAASTALCKDWASYVKVHRFMMLTSAALTLVHAAVAFTPLFELVVLDLMGIDARLVEPVRLGLRIMTPWTWAIAYRRFQQGVLIRYGESRAVGVGTLVRLITNAAVMTALFLSGEVPGVVVGTLGAASAVVAEALYVGWRVRPTIAHKLRKEPVLEPALALGPFLSFYVPLAMTPLMTLLVQPLGAASLARMPAEIASLAAWPPVYGFVFILRSVGMAYNEVVVALLGQPGARRVLARFTYRLCVVMVSLLALVAFTPLARLWFERVSGLTPELTAVAAKALFFALLMPGYAVLQSWYQGTLVHHHQTRGITEAVAIYLVIAATLLYAGVAWQGATGIYWALAAFSTGGVLQTLWLAWRCRVLAQEGTYS